MVYQSNPHSIALQLWTIRDAIAFDADKALRRVKGAGFSAVEIAPIPESLTPARLADLIASHGLDVVSIHGDLPTSENMGHWAELTREFRCPKIIWHGWPRDPRFDTPDGLDELILVCNEAGRLARSHGLQFGMHNHWWEFEPVEGAIPIRLFHESLHPETFWQLDVYWAQVAGVDPASELTRLLPRLGSIHWKDGPAVHGEPMTRLGRGRVDVPRVFQALTQCVDWVIELDECASDPLDAARQSLVYLESLKKGATAFHPPSDVDSVRADDL
jgi:sugar phosphate isomerase/epimerase